MTTEVRVVFVGTERAVMGTGPTKGLPWVAGKFVFDLCCGYQGRHVKTCLYGVLFYFAMKGLEIKPTPYKEKIMSLPCENPSVASRS